MTQTPTPTETVRPTPARRGNPASREAERRLARYFQSFGVSDPRRLAQLIDDALARVPAHRSDDVAAAALEAAEARVGAWFARILGRDEADGPAAALAGRAAFLVGDGPARWQGVFLRPRPPKAFVVAMRRAAVEPMPPSEPCVMAPQELAFWSPMDRLRPWFARPARVAYALLPGLVHGRWTV